jgi:hypothetical protein
MSFIATGLVLGVIGALTLFASFFSKDNDESEEEWEARQW